MLVRADPIGVMPTHHIGHDAYLHNAHAAQAVVVFVTSSGPRGHGQPLPILEASGVRGRYRAARLSEFAGPQRLLRCCLSAPFGDVLLDGATRRPDAGHQVGNEAAEERQAE